VKVIGSRRRVSVLIAFIGLFGSAGSSFLDYARFSGVEKVIEELDAAAD